MSDATANKRWFSLSQVEPGEIHKTPPLGEALAEDMSALKDKVASSLSSSWTTWTTGIPPNNQTDGGYEIDF